MCGVLFHAFATTPADPGAYAAALGHMSQRGPDFSNLETHGGFAIGHTRLSIIDTSDAGNQPFWDPDRRYALTYNGEIYNHARLRGELESRGAAFITQCDTEVLLKAIIVWGLEKTLARVRGMFAFVLHDTKTGETVAARDHFGQKPLYYATGANGLTMASDPLSVAAITGAQQPDLAAYTLYLSTEGETGTRGIHHPERSFFAGISMLPAGHLLKYNNGQASVERYFGPWQLFDPERYATACARSDDELMDELLELLEQSARRHLVADVPVGMLLSGGIDSSMLFWLTVARNPSLETFTKLSPGIETIPLDIVPRLLQKRSATAHFITQDKSGFVSDLDSFVTQSKAPSRWNSGPSMLSLCRSARRNGRIALSGGDCADEVFGGYIHYKDYFAGKPASDDLGLLVGVSCTGKSPAIIQDYMAGQNTIRAAILERLAGIDEPAEQQAQATLLHDTTTFLQSCVLPHSDAYSMMASVELRNPMLDLDLVGFAVNLPMRHKAAPHANGEFGKRLFRSLADREIGGFTNVRKEGTRNFAMAMAEPSFWHLDKFESLKLAGLPAPRSKRDIIRTVNLELFHNAYFADERRPLSSLMTTQGRQQFKVA
ncbi:MAG: asparagine synthase (glutamine-hydrolyzing) [Rhizobiales bacterium]|nr:asparagine synthase (glutamine-hydrolyzing) [Hyphomicrobiales bacterium]